jgi:hypothetical protein
MRIFVCALALAAMSTVAQADDRALTEQEIEGVQNAIKAVGCTVADSEIEAEKTATRRRMRSVTVSSTTSISTKTSTSPTR